MSWTQPAGAPPEPPLQAQTVGNQQNVYPNYQGRAPPGGQPQQYWQQPGYNQQYNQSYPQDYGNNANQFYQQPQYNQNFPATQQTFTNNQPQGYQQNYYQNQSGQHQGYPVPKQNADGWEDNWDWGWEESAKNAQAAAAQATITPGTAQPPPPQQVFNNANVIEESFNSTDTWNWSMEDKKDHNVPPQASVAAHPVLPVEPPVNAEQQRNTNSSTQKTVEEVRTLNDREIVKDKMPNLALGKRFHLENLTPQWSIESQMSQESSDGPQTHSESTHRSENQSRNSNKSSPGPNTDNSNFNYSQVGLDDYPQSNEWPRNEEPRLMDNGQGSRRESHNELSVSLQDMNIGNHENPAPDNRSNSSFELHTNNLHESAASNATNHYLPPAVPPTSSPAVVPPPTNFSTSASTNPFKQTGPLYHKKIPSSSPSLQTLSSTSSSSPGAVGKPPPSNRAPVGFGANLETTPDNSERPDQPQLSGFRSIPVSHQAPENLEVAPQNDRNEYLQTAHLSSSDYGENAEFSRGNEQPPPPPGLRRMVLGQLRADDSAPAGDEPPPGLARMVPGQHTEPPAMVYRDRHVEGQLTPEPPYPARRPAPAPDGSDYSDHYPAPPPATADDQRELIMEGENLQDLSVISSAEMSYSRDQTLEGAAEPAEDAADRRTDVSDGADQPAPSSRRHSLARQHTSAEDTDGDRAYRASPRRDRDKRKPSRDHERDRDQEGRYSRGDRKYDRESDRRSGRDDRDPRRDKDRKDRKERERRERGERGERGERDESRRATRPRYDTEDTDYYSDRERERRRYREGSYASKPPRPEDKGRRHDDRDRDRSRRYNTIERDRRYDDERDGRTRHDRRQRRDDRRRVVTFSGDASVAPPGGEYSPGRDAGSDDERRERRRRRPDPYYDGYVSGGPLAAQQYEYYERLRARDPAAYLRVYKQLVAAHQRNYADVSLSSYGGGGGGGFEAREERGSVHSGRSSAGLKGNDTYGNARDSCSLRDAPSLRTDLSDRDLATDASLNLHLEDSTVRSERMTPFKFSSSHVKGSLSSRNVVVVRAGWGAAGVHVVSLRAALQHLPDSVALSSWPGPLVHGVTHKKSVIDYCMSRVRTAASGSASSAAGGPGRDLLGYVLVWELLALLLRQNGVVVGADIAELLMRNTQEYEHRAPAQRPASHSAHDGSRRGSALSARDDDSQRSLTDLSPVSDVAPPPQAVAPTEAAALNTLREHLSYGNRQDALEWAMNSGLWAHALCLSALSSRRARAAVLSRWLQALPRADPLHTLYAHLTHMQPPAVTSVADERWGDWRPHAAMLLANTSSRPDEDKRNIIQLGDSLMSRGLAYSAQFCYVCAGAEWARHPLAPYSARGAGAAPASPRLALLLAEPRARTPAQLATNQALFATEIYEYAISLSNPDYVINEFQEYKLVLASRLADVGQYERALRYAESTARTLARAPKGHVPAFVRHLADLADRLKHVEPTLSSEAAAEEGADSGEPSPRRDWLHDVTALAHQLKVEADASAQSTPQHLASMTAPVEPVPVLDPSIYQQQQYSWPNQSQQQYLQPEAAQAQAQPTYEQQDEPPAPDYSQYYQPTPPAQADHPEPHYGDDWATPAHAQTGHDPYWQGDYGGYGEEPARPVITMPGAASAQSAHYHDDDHDPPLQPEQDSEPSDGSGGGGGGGGKADKTGKDEGKGKSGWLGGILNKLSLRPPNQMILPDDKNPTIVWDAEHKRWKNLDGSSEGSGPPPPPPPPAGPPPAAALPAPAPAPSSHQDRTLPPGAAPPPAAPVANIFKMQKSRHIKKSYVDVFKQSSATSAAPPAELLAAPLAPAASAAPLNYFVPPSGAYEGGSEQYRGGL